MVDAGSFIANLEAMWHGSPGYHSSPVDWSACACIICTWSQPNPGTSSGTSLHLWQPWVNCQDCRSGLYLVCNRTTIIVLQWLQLANLSGYQFVQRQS